ncbi:Stk1 family PASTA domain-containing Ser/Thr kinase [Arthrobacter castelli]|uniref:Stk1 family PASTA domain-containing Ser/Thr kinase n=1 Tax=Arthrobacter castelli TaxID=271431 RepID=UPI0003F8E666|nr:Stk1 family PASTA domain-containing Ser/Thr kinase [Arthrobacter castelli]
MSEQRVLDGRYEVGELIGRGGMADVHLGRDVRLGRSVAIKLLRPDLARDPQFRTRFRREAQAVAGLNHPSIVSVYDTGDQEVANGITDAVTVPFIVMEYVAGRTLRDLERSKEVTIGNAIEHTLGVLSALEYSHRSGIVHRDIKPANVIVTPDETVKVMDFGIARAIADSAATMTQTQAVIGTAQYLSPEQARGESVDARSDLYSAACLLYEMLTGRPPFVGESPVSVAYQHVREMPEPPSHFNPEVGSALDSVMNHALEKDRQERFQDAAAFRRALRAARTGVALTPPAPAVPEEQGRNTEAVTAPVATGAAGAAAAGATAAADETRTEAMPRAGASGDADHPQTRAMTAVATAQLDIDDAAAGGSGTDPAPAAGDDDGYGGPIDFHEEEYEPPRKRRRGGWIAALVVGLLVVLGAAGFYLYSTMTAEPPPPPLVKIPDVADMTEAQALSALYENDLDPQTERVENESVAKGIAIGTSPEAAAKVEEGSTVELLISTGPNSVTIPKKLQGQSEASVRDSLQQLGLVGGTTESVDSATVPAGQLIGTNPELGESVPAESTVDLIVSTGNVTVPALTGDRIEDAEAALQDPAISLPYSTNKKETADAAPGTVVSQSIQAGTAVTQETEIVLTVAVEPEEEPETQEPTPSPSPSPSSSSSPSSSPSASPSPDPTGTASTPPED